MPPVITYSLQSGSNGNCIFVEACGVKLLIDAGIAGCVAAKRLGAYGRNIRDCDALLISHEHVDHTRGAGTYHRMFGLPVYFTRATFAATKGIGRLKDVRYFRAGDSLEFGTVTVHTIRTPHDAVDGVAFVVEAEGKRLGILTDLGHPFAGLAALLSDVDAAYLESNYDPELLETGSYPAALKARIRGDGGHLSNEEAAGLARTATGRRLRWVAMAHLSERNNRPQLALAAHRRAVGEYFPVYHASRYEVGPQLEV